MWQFSYSDANGASLGNYFSKNGVFGQKLEKSPIKTALAPKPATFFDEVMGVCGFFFKLNLLPPYLLRSQGLSTFGITQG